MLRCAALLAISVALAACEAPAQRTPAPQTIWQYAPAPIAWDLGPLKGRFGRGMAPAPLVSVGVVAPALRADGIDPAKPAPAPVPLTRATALPVPGPGPARAVVYGTEVDTAVELIDVDAGRVLWRDHTVCHGPVVGVTEKVAVCTDAKGTRALGWDGAQKWATEHPFLAMTDDRIAALIGDGVVAILDADTGDELSRVTMPAGVDADSILATCGDAGRELFAVLRDGRLARIAEGKGGPAIAWAVAIPAGGAHEPNPIRSIDACVGSSVLVTSVASSVLALARDSGRVTGQIDGVRGWWPARDGGDRIEVATPIGVVRTKRDLAGDPEILPLPRVGALIASRGDRRLVAAGRGTAVLLDRDGPRAYVQLAQTGGVLGDRALLADSLPGPGEAPTRWLLPDTVRRTVRIAAALPAITVPGELRDLPPVEPAGATDVIELPEAPPTSGALFAVDPTDGAALYIATGTQLSRVDLRAKRGVWTRAGGCENGAVGLVVVGDVVVCAGGDHLQATTRAGAPAWDRADVPGGRLTGAGDTVLLGGERGLRAFDAATGAPRGEIAETRAALAVADRTTYLLVAERGRIVARLPAAHMLAAWSLAVDGHVTQIHAAGDGVLVELDGGDAYRIDVRTAAAVAVPALGLTWTAYGDVLAGGGPGGALYDAPVAPPPAPKKLKLPLGPQRALPPLDDPGAPMSVPVPTPPSARIAWQLALFDPSGGVRARGEYALEHASLCEPRGPAGSPFVVTGAAPDGARDALVLDARTGDPLRRFRMSDPSDVFPGCATLVDNRPVVWKLAVSPLRVELF